ncbi:ATPase [Paenibacillus psychroresistens]|uniref:ATPase n=1 Tax=Paenibacillus psychroresistens TaxID=1778678 RepID=A0A6B8RMM8_9BACL|nr:ATPase [Paenibacillus psychroresistens]QGQ97024.1 ATPase [Paenibacillus psychroresistens]
MIVKFIELVLHNFKAVRDLSLDYTDVLKLTGKNGEGKTSIGEAPVWIMWGKDLFGADYTKGISSPRPTTYEYDKVFASILLSIDGSEYKFAREIDGSSNNFYVNDVGKTASEFKDSVSKHFEQDEFMALYYPGYFFNLHKDKQREQLVQAVPVPLNKMVFEEMSRLSPDQDRKDIKLNPQAEKLAEMFKKQSVDDIKAIHAGPKNKSGLNAKLKTDHISAQSKTKTLKEQLQRLPSVVIDIASKQTAVSVFDTQITEIEKVIATAGETNSVHTSLQNKATEAQRLVNLSKDKWLPLRDEVIEDTCKTCKQPVLAESLAAVTSDKDRRKTEYQANHKALVAARDEANQLLAEAKYIDVTEQFQNIRDLEQKRNPLLEEIRNQQERERLTADVEKAKTDEEKVLADLRESTFILDAVKAFKSKETEIQAESIQAMFTSLSVRLHKYVKSNDEWEPDFSVQMNGKDFVSLSFGEKITAGLELTEVLFKNSNLITPVFVDGVGEYTGEYKVFDQLITAQAVLGQALQINGKEVAA